VGVVLFLPDLAASCFALASFGSLSFVQEVVACTAIPITMALNSDLEIFILWFFKLEFNHLTTG
jgi:hypothetical protein